MVDFGKLLEEMDEEKPTNPIDIFEFLNKISGKKHLREAQKLTLKEWYSKNRGKSEILIKLPTGEGKTLIGLLMLLTSLAEGKGPVMYLCPDKYLVQQTIDQAKSFGINTVEFKTPRVFPRKFLNSEAILVTTCQKLFNGLSIFGVQRGSIQREIRNIGSIVMDDAHKCLEVIRESFSVTIHRFIETNGNLSENVLFDKIFKIFRPGLETQAPGTVTDIEAMYRKFLAVPFWSWYEKVDAILQILRDFKDTDELKFKWDLINDQLRFCRCIISGKKIEIHPRIIPLFLIPSFVNAERKIFLSATLTKDEFLVRDLGINPIRVKNPITGNKLFGGERLIIIPALIDPEINTPEIISIIQDIAEERSDFGIFVLVPSRRAATRYYDKGRVILGSNKIKKTITELEEEIKNKTANEIIILVNRYDGIDLPEDICRILCIDSLPKYMSLIDQYETEMRPKSTTMRRMMAQRIEQGIGRCIRGSGDWGIVIILGDDLTDFLSEKAKVKYFSREAQIQIEIGEYLANPLKGSDEDSTKAIEALIYQCLNRDQDWIRFYLAKISKVQKMTGEEEFIEKARLEREAEELFRKNLVEEAVQKVNDIIGQETNFVEKGWYLQLKATYLYQIDKSKSMDCQLKAHTQNQLLFKPPTSVYTKLLPTQFNRERSIKEWIVKHEHANAVLIEVRLILAQTSFEMPAKDFEEGINNLGLILGFNVQRPEKESGMGSDNLWNLSQKKYWIIECKNEVVAEQDKGISKSDINQLNGSIAWFNENYPDSRGYPVIIHPADYLNKDAFINNCGMIDIETLDELKNRVLNFYKSFKQAALDELDEKNIKERLHDNQIDLEQLESLPKKWKRHK